MEDNITRITLDPPAQEPEVKAPETTTEPEAPRETPQETPPVPPVETPAEVDPVSIFKETVGLTPDEIKQLKQEYESIKGKTVLDDPELLPDDDFLKDFIKTYKRGGNATAYLEAMQTDFSKMSAEEIVKYELRKSNPGLPEKFIQRKADDFMRREFNVQDEYENEEDEAYAKELLRIYAEDKRAKFEEEKKKFQIPERKQPEADNSIQEQVEQFNKFVLENPVTKSLVEGKKVAFGDFNYQADPEMLTESAIDSTKFFNLFAKQDGTVDLDKFYRVTAIANDPDRFLKAYSAHEVAKAKIEWLKELKNPSVDPSTKPPTGEIKVRLVS